jgi:DNA-binding transcriptional LysR family regulator
MSWDDLRIVLAVHRSRTMTAAAAALGVTHTTVGRRLRACERQLGVRLFDRLPDGLRATAAGAELVHLAESIEQQVVETEARVVGRDLELRGPLRVSTLDLLVAPTRAAFASFVARYPSVDLTLHTSVASVSLLRREADVVLRLTPAPPEGLVGRRVGRLRFAVFAAAELVARVGADAPWDTFPWLGLEPGGWTDQWLAGHAPGARIVLRMEQNATLIREMVLAGVGAFLLPQWEGETLGLRQLGPALPEPVDVWLLTHPDLRQTGRVRGFLDHMEAALPRLPVFAR